MKSRVKYYLPFVLGLLIILFISSCGCNYHLKRAQVKCGKKLLTDTVMVHDTTLVDRVTKDTVFYFNQIDTVVVKEGRLTMKYFYRDSTVYLSGTCDTIKIIKEIPVQVMNTTLSPEFNFWKWGMVVLAILMLILLFKK